MRVHVAIYLGFDLGTQGLTAIAIEVEGSRREVVCERAFDFDAELSDYGTRHGVLPDDDPLVATAPPLLWAEALDRMVSLVAAERGFDRARLRAVAGAAQQHGSVYLRAGAAPALAALDPGRPLARQLGGIFARKTAPIWMDSSTAVQCGEITRALGGPENVASLTGSRAFERFTGPQIRKWFQLDADGYGRTATIHLVSSFLASLLSGTTAPIDWGDGAGMNLMHLARREWAPAALEATAPGLAEKLPPLTAPWTVVGPLGRYWTERYGLPAARVVAWTGDNPSSLIGTGLVAEGGIAVSLGTSDTLFGPMREPRVDPAGYGSVFGAPTGDYMGLVCFKNGSLARDRVRRDYGMDWLRFSEALRATPAGNLGRILVPWFEPEITPTVLAPRMHAYGLDPSSGASNARAVVEAQMMALANHAGWMGVRVKQIRATGGAAANREILQVMADVFGAEVVVVGGHNASALGAALRAYHADEKARGHDLPWPEVVAGFAEPWPASGVSPIPAHAAVYRDLRPIYAACEAHALGAGPDPAFRLEEFRRRYGG